MVIPFKLTKMVLLLNQIFLLSSAQANVLGVNHIAVLGACVLMQTINLQQISELPLREMRQCKAVFNEHLGRILAAKKTNRQRKKAMDEIEKGDENEHYRD